MKGTWRKHLNWVSHLGCLRLALNFYTDQNTLLVLWLYNISWARSLGFQVHSKWMVDLQKWSWSGLQSRFSIRFASVAATFFVTRQCKELLRGGIGLFNDFILVWSGMPLSSAFQWINRIWKVKWKNRTSVDSVGRNFKVSSQRWMCEKHDQLEKERKFISHFQQPVVLKCLGHVIFPIQSWK